ncbi:hypothetical protein ACWCQZ_45255 [Streptomyces sp. NPDC002285]
MGEPPAAGATLRQRSEAIAPELAGHVAAVGVRRRLRPAHRVSELSAWATKLRLGQAGLVEAANESAGRMVVRGLSVLAPGSVPAAELAGVDTQSATAPQGPVKAGGRQGRDTAARSHQQARPVNRVDPAIAEAAGGGSSPQG